MVVTDVARSSSSPTTTHITFLIVPSILNVTSTARYGARLVKLHADG